MIVHHNWSRVSILRLPEGTWSLFTSVHVIRSISCDTCTPDIVHKVRLHASNEATAEVSL
jgi:hypothetical protein